MWKVYLKQIRYLLKENKFFSVVYIVGTALSITMVMLILMAYHIKTGNIGGCAGTNASTRLKLNTPRMLKKIPDEPQQLMVIPTSRIRTDGDVEVLFIINETTFKYKIPANTKWEKGKRYIYNLLFNGKDITLENVSTSEWLPVEGNMENMIL